MTVFKCRLCGKECGAAQGRGAHESYCAKEKGAQLIGSGSERHFILNGKRIDAPNSKNTQPSRGSPVVHEPAENMGAMTIKDRAKEKAQQLAAMMEGQAMRVRDIGVLYGKLVGKPNLTKSTVSGFLRTHNDIFVNQSFGMYKAIDGQQARPTSLAKNTSNHPSEIAESEIPELTPEQAFQQDAVIAHGAVANLQKAAALLQFSTLMEEIGAAQAVAMVAGMSKLGKAINGRR